ncbi:hypothetical protein MKK50_18325 [Methylobacterium sp. J-043]|nr:hypothetical protein [Methylobacterium sp. J-043]
MLDFVRVEAALDDREDGLRALPAQQTRWPNPYIAPGRIQPAVPVTCIRRPDVPSTLPIEHHIPSPFTDPAFLASRERENRKLERRYRGIETDVLTLRAAATIASTAPDPATRRIAYRLLVRCSILAAMNLTDCEGEALENSFFAMKEQAERGDDRLVAFQSHIDTVIAATHTNAPREVLPVVWCELGPFIRLLIDRNWAAFLQVIAWCSAENFWDDPASIRQKIRLLRRLRQLIGNASRATN